MKKTLRFQTAIAVLALAVSSAPSLCFAQSSGEATYKAKCQMCHGADGLGATPGRQGNESCSVHRPSDS